jgi:hypothetical protein
MPVILAQLGATVGGILITMAGQLVTERFLKYLVVRGLHAVVTRTENTDDDRLLSEAARAWGVEAPESPVKPAK